MEGKTLHLWVPVTVVVEEVKTPTRSHQYPTPSQRSIGISPSRVERFVQCLRDRGGPGLVTSISTSKLDHLTPTEGRVDINTGIVTGWVPDRRLTYHFISDLFIYVHLYVFT